MKHLVQGLMAIGKVLGDPPDAKQYAYTVSILIKIIIILLLISSL